MNTLPDRECTWPGCTKPAEDTYLFCMKHLKENRRSVKSHTPANDPQAKPVAADWMRAAAKELHDTWWNVEKGTAIIAKHAPAQDSRDSALIECLERAHRLLKTTEYAGGLSYVEIGVTIAKHAQPAARAVKVYHQYREVPLEEWPVVSYGDYLRIAAQKQPTP